MGNRIIGMQAVNVKHVQATIFKIRRRLIKGHSKQVGKWRVVFLVILLYFREYCLAVEAGMFVALPRIDGMASALNAALHHGLAESEVRFSVMDAQLNQGRWTKTADQVASEWQMAKPVVKPRVKALWAERM
jgi:hypothetical protein